MARKLDRKRVEELRDDGMRCRDAGFTAEVCPWPLFSPESKEWLHGWSMAGRFPA